MNETKHRKKDRAKRRSGCAPTAAQTVAGEDLEVGDYVAVLEQTYEFASFLWCGVDVQLMPPDEPVRVRMAPLDSGVPLRVAAVCVPFVLAKHPKGGTRSLDLRLCRLARVDRGYGRAAWRLARGKRAGKRRKRHRS